MFDPAERDHRHEEPSAGDPASQLRGLVDAASAALEQAARLDVSQLDGEALGQATLQLEQLRRYTDSAESHTLAALDQLGATDASTGQATSKWLAHRAGLPVGTARSRLALATRLDSMAEVDEALTAGTIGVAHARILADALNDRNAAAMGPMIGELIEASTGAVFGRWRANVVALGALLDPDGPHDPRADLSANRLTLSPTDGFLLARGELVGEHALTVHDTLNAVADELFHQFSEDRDACPEVEVPRRATLLALALEEVCRRALAVDRSSTRAPGVEASIVIDARDDGLAAGAWRIRDALGSPLPADALPTFLCDPVLYAVLVDSLGLPVDLGRASRVVTPAQRRALTQRDGGCAFPGCDAPPSWCDAHHVRHWLDGGATDLPNLVLLCRRHHRVAHRRGWSLTLHDDGWTSWNAPTGATFWGQRQHRQRAGPAPPG